MTFSSSPHTLSTASRMYPASAMVSCGGDAGVASDKSFDPFERHHPGQNLCL